MIKCKTKLMTLIVAWLITVLEVVLSNKAVGLEEYSEFTRVYLFPEDFVIYEYQPLNILNVTFVHGENGLFASESVNSFGEPDLSLFLSPALKKHSKLSDLYIEQLVKSQINQERYTPIPIYVISKAVINNCPFAKAVMTIERRSFNIAFHLGVNKKVTYISISEDGSRLFIHDPRNPRNVIAIIEADKIEDDSAYFNFKGPTLDKLDRDCRYRDREDRDPPDDSASGFITAPAA